jgi:hypothetical protein
MLIVTNVTNVTLSTFGFDLRKNKKQEFFRFPIVENSMRII